MNCARWTPEEDARVRKLAQDGMTVNAMCRVLGRSYNSVYGYLRQNRIPHCAEERLFEDRRAAQLQEATWSRLASRYSSERATLIMEGRDPATQADLAAWRSLGQRSAA